MAFYLRFWRPTMATARTTTGETDKIESPPPTERNSAPSRDDLRDLVREVVAEALGKTGDKGGDKGGDNDAPRARRARDEEDEITEKVRAAQRTLRAEEEREGRIKTLEDTVQRVTERPPARSGFWGRAQRFMWGDDGS